jgi:hypothetical protein
MLGISLVNTKELERLRGIDKAFEVIVRQRDKEIADLKK